MADPLGLSPDGSSGSTLSDPLPNLAQPVATTGVNAGTGVVGMSPAATLAETNAMVGQFAVYTYPGCNTNSAPRDHKCVTRHIRGQPRHSPGH